VITGLPEDDNVDDADLFGDLCQNNLSCKPLVLKRIRLGKRSADKTRKLLVRLRNDGAASEILKAAHHLRKSIDQRIAKQVYINEDLSPEAAKLAYEARQRRRRQQQQQRVETFEDTVPVHHALNPAAAPFNVQDGDNCQR